MPRGMDVHMCRWIVCALCITHATHQRAAHQRAAPTQETMDLVHASAEEDLNLGPLKAKRSTQNHGTLVNAPAIIIAIVPIIMIRLFFTRFHRIECHYTSISQFSHVYY